MGIKSVIDSCDSLVVVVESVGGGVASHLTIRQKYSMTLPTL